MTQTVQVLEGRVAKVTLLQNNRWLVVDVVGKSKPLGINLEGFNGLWPRAGDRISVEVNEGERWFFAEHRTLVIKKSSGPYPTLPSEDPGFFEYISYPILEWLQHYPQVSSDDVHVPIMNRAGGRSVNMVGRAFSYLAKKRRIHRVGRMKSKRPSANAREIGVWELSS